MPYGVDEDYRIPLAPTPSRRPMSRTTHAPTSADWIMDFPDYGVCKVCQGERPRRYIALYLHAGYFSQRRWDRYCTELKAGQLTRIQAHHSMAWAAEEHTSSQMNWRIAKAVRTRKLSRAEFCDLLDLLGFLGLQVRAERP